MSAAVERPGNARAATPGERHEPSADRGIPSPTVQKYGTVLLEEGFSQHSRVVEDYLRALGLCSTEILLVQVLESYRWEADREIYPGVRTLALRCGVKARRVSQMTAHLVELGLLVKIERFTSRSRATNYYDLEPLYRKAAAWRDEHIALHLAEQEALTSRPFQPCDMLEEVAQVISEEFGEPAPSQIRYNVQRLERRWEQHPHLEWRPFLDLVEQAVNETEARQKERTRTGQTFNQLVPYFFSTLDRLLARSRSLPGLQTCDEWDTTPDHGPDQSRSQQTDQQQAPALSRSCAPRVLVTPADTATQTPPIPDAATEVQPGARVQRQAPQTLALHMSAISLTFNDEYPRSSLSQAANLWHESGLPEEILLQLVGEARAEASRHSIKTRTAQGHINRMPYFFAALRRRIAEYRQQRIC